MQVWLSTRKGLFCLDDSGGALQIRERHFPGVAVSLSHRDARDGAIYAALGHGHFGVHLHRSDDEGRSFVEVAAPAYPPKPVGHVDLDPMRQIDRAWSTELVWALASGGPAQPGRLWCGTIPGGLFRSDDRGGSWELVRSLWDRPERAQAFGGGYDLPGLHSVCVNQNDPDDIVIGISCGGAWRTRDGGGSWELTTGMWAEFLPPGVASEPASQDPHHIVRCPAAPDVLWTQHHNGIFRSTDGGSTWAEITGVAPSAFGFAVAVHPSDPDTAWFVPGVSDLERVPVDGRLMVNITHDGGRSFTAMSAGLPQRDAYHLVYRHGLAVDSTGERLVMASTTGSAWASQDGGSTWELLTADLPPVLAVDLVD